MVARGMKLISQLKVLYYALINQGYYFNLEKRKQDVHAFPKGISKKDNIIVPQEFKF